MHIPKVFVSYSHDSTEHKKWVLDLATGLRASGVDAIIDQWDLRPGDDLPRFMETHLASADRVLMVCTEKYVEKANAGVGGVGYERMIVTADLLGKIDSNKVIPLVRQAGVANLPIFLRTKLYLDFSRPDQSEFSFDELVRTLHNAPLFVKPPVSTSPFPAVPKPAQPAGNGLLQLMTTVVREFEGSTSSLLLYANLVYKMKISRVMTDLLFAEGVQKGLLRRSSHEWYEFTEQGKLFALENDLIGKHGAA